MKGIILGILAGISLLLMKATQAFGFTDAVPNSATYTSGGIIGGYRDWISRQWSQKIANNTAYNWRHSDQALLIGDDSYNTGQERTYDTARDYRNSYVFIYVVSGAATIGIPYVFATGSPGHAMRQLTTTYQNILLSSDWQIRALNTGGIMIKYNGAAQPYYIGGLILECRKPAAS